jgi:Lrp/AsnC family leucine-responsive transcriptional regulator
MHVLAILREPLEDSRCTVQGVDAAVKLSPTACWYRINRLEAGGVIKQYSIELDRTRLGYRDTEIVQLTLERHTDETLFEFGRVMSEIPRVM